MTRRSHHDALAALAHRVVGRFGLIARDTAGAEVQVLVEPPNLTNQVVESLVHINALLRRCLDEWASNIPGESVALCKVSLPYDYIPAVVISRSCSRSVSYTHL